MDKSFISVTLNKGAVAIVDLEFKEFVESMNWHLHADGYAYGRNKKLKKMQYMHRAIMNAPVGVEVDHINHDKLDNRKCNLRLCTSSQNKAAAIKYKTWADKASIYKGVGWNKHAGKWIARIKVNKKSIHLGVFIDEQEAALAYNKKAVDFFGEFAVINEL